MNAYGRFAAIYDELMADMPYPEWVRLTTKLWAERGARPQTVVDLGCGTGNIAVLLAMEGYDVIGIDRSQAMLDVAEQKKRLIRSARDASYGSLDFLRQDMRRLQLSARAEAIVSYCDSLNYVTDESGLLAVFHRVHQFLSPGGMFIFDMLTAAAFRRYGEESPFALDGEEIAYIWNALYEEDTNRMTHDLHFFVRGSDGRYDRIHEIHVQKAYEIDWVRQSLLDCGFAEVEVFSGFERQAPDAGTERVFFSAVKKEA